VLGKPFGQEQLLAAVEVLLYQGAAVVPLRQKSARAAHPTDTAPR
jgi:hypothetical protein